MERITIKNLQAVVDCLNRETGSPMTPYTRNADGQLVANIGNYHLDQAYGGVKLVRMYSGGGGITDPISMGFCTKREAYQLIHAYLRGLEYKVA